MHCTGCSDAVPHLLVDMLPSCIWLSSSFSISSAVSLGLRTTGPRVL